jgi:3,4-dihydroxy 2-butanone 4-phosphate synthase / GTP cyclohydrolase II
MSEIKLNSIEDAVKDFKEGKFVIVVDDEDRENEGDLIIAAEKIDAEKVNFMLKHARGVLCAPITLSRCDELDLPHQVSENTSVLGTPFSLDECHVFQTIARLAERNEAEVAVFCRHVNLFAHFDE